MSYILDALKKSERERSLGSVPSLESVHDSAANRTSPMLAWWIVGLLTLLVLLLAAWLWRAELKERFSSTTPSENPVTELQTTVQQTPDTQTTQKDKPSPATTSVETKQAAVLRNQAKDQAMQPAEKSQQVRTQSRNQSASTTAASSQPVSRSPVQTTATPAKKVQPVGPQPSQDAVQPVQTEEILTLEELPDSIRFQIPPIKINVVSFTKEPEKRFLMVEGIVYREGDVMPGGVELEQITANGPIVRFRGERFLVTP